MTVSGVPGDIALYDGIKQGAFARYFDREELSLYLVKKIYLHASEGELISLAQLCIEWAVCDRIMEEREGVGRSEEELLRTPWSWIFPNW